MVKPSDFLPPPPWEGPPLPRGKRKFKKGDIVSFYDSLTSYVVLGYKELLPTFQERRRIRVVIKQVVPPPKPGRELSYASEEDLVER